MRIVVGSDHAGFELKEHLKQTLADWGHEVTDCGCHSVDSVDYPLLAEAVCLAVIRQEAERGLLVCGTGQGMAMTANRIPGIRAAVCQEPFSAHAAREHNDANVLAVGARVVGTGMAELVLKEFMNTDFAGGRHARRVGLIAEIEAKYRKQEV
ncbi:MAG: ribose 5-phosphate isomerase B [Solirubrobacterales bacterium]